MHNSAARNSHSFSSSRDNAVTTSRNNGRGSPISSRQAKEAWYRAAYRQAVNARTWHLGDAIDDRTRDVILAGLGGATPPIYRGPDNRYSFQNAHTLEGAATRNHRARYFAGRTPDEVRGPKMPGEDEYVAALRSHDSLSQPANDNRRWANDCTQEYRDCRQLCSAARHSPDMRNIWGGSQERCMKGCLSAACGGNSPG